ncbi:MAG: hypothetical protein M3O70_09115 [Actinomycetota bacterium]|nr:hypothetical protein [Actinomycetota bacterium]
MPAHDLVEGPAEGSDVERPAVAAGEAREVLTAGGESFVPDHALLREGDIGRQFVTRPARPGLRPVSARRPEPLYG